MFHTFDKFNWYFSIPLEQGLRQVTRLVSLWYARLYFSIPLEQGLRRYIQTPM